MGDVVPLLDDFEAHMESKTARLIAPPNGAR